MLDHHTAFPAPSSAFRDERGECPCFLVRCCNPCHTHEKHGREHEGLVMIHVQAAFLWHVNTG